MSPRSRSSIRTTITLIFILIVAIAGIIYVTTGNDYLGLFIVTETSLPSTPTNTPAAPLAITAGTQDWWEVYFTDPLTVNDPENYSNSIEQVLIDKINAAQVSIHIVSFEFNLTPVAEALIAAHQRGVDVRWVTDDENGLEADSEPEAGQFALLTGAGIQVRSDDRSALMHDKFWIFDGETVWTGSTNITVNGIFEQNNNVIVIHSPEVAAMYEREFQEMWDGQFGPTSPSTLEQQSAIVEGTPIHVLFSPEDGVVDRIIAFVQGAQTSIRFLAFSFTDYPLADAMRQRAAAGVDVAGVFEKVGSDTEAAELDTLYCAHIPVRQDGNGGFMHDKVIIIDGHIVITGSLNFSSSADEDNDENVIILDNAEIAALYLQEFERVYAQGSDPDPAKMACP
jgi:phosphatidylserine/phosphatidylglycerophosphate/cardiolipin synthase-like enzyme